MIGDKNSYLGNPNLKKSNVPLNFTQEQVEEYLKCSEDPVYFMKNYIKIVNLDKGLINFELYPFQEELVRTIRNNRFVIAKMPRQCGKSTTIISDILHHALFNENQTIAILANKEKVAKLHMDRLKMAYENLPKWLQQGIKEWNKFSIELENGSKVIASATSASAIRGGSYNYILLDEFAFVPENIANDELFVKIRLSNDDESFI
jgi:phage terminase large subunit-like protein